jgi:hypothetical protein
VTLHTEDTGLVVQLLGDIFSDAFHLAAAAAGRGVGLVVALAARKIRWQRLAFGLFLDAGRRSIGGLELFDLIIDGLQVFIERFFQQASLLGAEALALGGKLQAFENGILMRELVDGGLFEGDRL